MWFFNSPQIVFGEGSLSHLAELKGRRACIVTDATLVQLGHLERIKEELAPTGLELQVFTEIEPDPSLETVRNGAEVLKEFQPDWIIALGGGSVMDAAKAMWVLYERPGYAPEAINPVETLELRGKARFAAIPTTAGTGSEATWAVVLTDKSERRKLALGNREAVPDLAILDPEMVKDMPPRLTADTGLDVLTHAVEGFTCAWKNVISDGMCLQAVRMVFEYLPCSYRDGDDIEARIAMQNAAAIAGLGFGNANAALAHGMGHTLGAIFHVPHGRAVGLFLPYTIEFCIRGDPESTCYTPLAHSLGLRADSEVEAAASLVSAIRDLETAVEQPQSIQNCGIRRDDFERELDLLVANALNDTTTLMSTRIPDDEEMRRLFQNSYNGTPIDF
jgi:alcohol dehydrogenase class IV